MGEGIQKFLETGGDLALVVMGTAVLVWVVFQAVGKVRGTNGNGTKAQLSSTRRAVYESRRVATEEHHELMRVAERTATILKDSGDTVARVAVTVERMDAKLDARSA